RWFVAATLAVLILAALPPHAEAGPEPPTFLATAYNTQRKLARAEDGLLYAAVTKNVSNTPIVRVLSTDDGATWATLPPPTTTGLASDRSSLAIDVQGRLHIVWTELQVAGGQVFYARYASGAWSAPEQLSHSPSYAGFPSIAVDGQDRAHVAWYGFDGAFYQIYYRRLDPSGWTSETALTNEAVDATNPALALDPDAHVHIAWFRQNRNATLNEVAYLRLENDAIVETRTVSPSLVDAINPSLLVDGSGRVRIAWTAALGTERIQYAERAPGGTWSAVEFASPAGTGALHPSLAMDRGGEVRVVWEGADRQIYTQTRSGASAWSYPAALTSGGVNRYPSARWSQFNNPMCPDSVGIDVVWTHEVSGALSLAWTSLSGAGCATGPTLGALAIAAGIFAVVVAATVAAVLLLRKRRKGPLPPNA
ncbi:MAG TPA: sialidase family protein, partial [Thermoplasmata archaeon]|nr:sialidase family protein [Thermoplasmata archaeon]